MNAPLKSMPIVAPLDDPVYPSSDGQPMAESTRHFDWIVTIQGGLNALFLDDPDVFVAGDLLWYPVEGRPEIRVAPDVMVVFGRIKGHRGSYIQFREGGVVPQVVFEIVPPGDREAELAQKYDFYLRFGVEEYYLYDPERGDLRGWLRAGDRLEAIAAMEGWISPRLGVTFGLRGVDLRLVQPDGQVILSYQELSKEIDRLERKSREIRESTRLADRERDAVREQIERMEKKLRSLGIDPDA